MNSLFDYRFSGAITDSTTVTVVNVVNVNNTICSNLLFQVDLPNNVGNSAESLSEIGASVRGVSTLHRIIFSCKANTLDSLPTYAQKALYDLVFMINPQYCLAFRETGQYHVRKTALCAAAHSQTL